jgi:hypothetical protein
VSKWSIVVPEAATNLVTDPECTALDFYNAIGSTLTVSSTYARFGYTTLKVVTDNSAANEGVYADLIAASVGASYTFSIYARGSGTINLRILWYTVTPTFISASTGAVITLSNTGWTRYTLTAVAPATTASAQLSVDTDAQQSITFYADGWQLEAVDHVTTFVSGNQAGCRWNGLYNGSTSTRDAQERSGGRLRDLEDTYGWRVLEYAGAGMPPLVNNLQPLALQPGAQFVSTTVTPRQLILQSEYHAGTLATLHGKRQDILDVIKPDAVRGAQPFVLCYTGGTRALYASFRYDDGMQINAYTAGTNFVEKPTIGLLAVDPFWYEDDQQLAALAFTASLASNNYAAARINGTWQNLGTGFNGVVYCVKTDSDTGRVYYCGNFTTANGVTVNSVCYWNGTTFVAMGSGTAGVAGGAAVTMAIAQNGDVWVGGLFTSAGGSAADGLARWNSVANNWTCFTNGTPGDLISAIAIDIYSNVYIGGTFANWDGIAAADNLAKWNGSAWSALSTGANAGVFALAFGADGTTLYVGGNFTSPQTRIMSWNGSAFSEMGGGASGAINTLAVSREGTVYAGGVFSTTPTTSRIAKWTGNAWSSLGSGLNGNVTNIAVLGDGSLFVSGDFTAAGSLSSAPGAALWNGSSWARIDIDAPSGVVYAAEALGDDLYIGNSNAGTATVSGKTTVVNSSTALSFPIIVITGTTTAGASGVVTWLENQSTKQRMYFYLWLVAGDVVTIDLSPLKKTVVSNRRGRLLGNPLANSEFSNWCLLPGSNTIAAYITGTTTGVTMNVIWRPVHWGVDGTS